MTKIASFVLKTEKKNYKIEHIIYNYNVTLNVKIPWTQDLNVH